MFYFNDVQEQLKANILKNLCSEWVFGFVIDYAWISKKKKLLRIFCGEKLLWPESWWESLHQLPSFFSQILDLIYWTVLIIILIYFEWRDTEKQQQGLKRRVWYLLGKDH